MKSFLGVVCVVVCLGLSTLGHTETFNVDPLADNDCTDFICDFQNAISVAAGNGFDDTILLAPGVYNTSGGPFQYISIENKSLTIIGSGADQTFLDGGGTNSVLAISTHFISADSAADITIQDVTVQNGSTTGPIGGGLIVLTNDADISIEGCVFNLNEVVTPANSEEDGGGGLYAVTINTGSVFVLNSRFTNNFAPDSNGGGSFTVSTAGKMLLEGNIYQNNFTLGSPSIETFGGGAFANSVFGELVINRNLFIGNDASGTGGGLAALSIFGTGLITNNVIARNTSTNFGGGGSLFTGGGGLFALAAVTGSVAMTNNTIVENTMLGGDGGGLLAVIATNTAEMTLANNIIWGNTATDGATCTTSCNDIAVLDDFTASNTGGSFSISHSNFSDIFFQCNVNVGCTPNQDVDVATNRNLDPLFVAPFQNDFHLSDISLLIDRGSSLALGLPSLDFDEELRIQGAAPDMGAFESSATPFPGGEHCANNVDDDGDGDIDCSDAECAGAAACLGNNQGGLEHCANNEDDDGDGTTDCGDENCVGAIACQPAAPGSGENCANNVDDDGDGDIDCLDSACLGAAACAGAEAPADGGGGCSLTESKGPFSTTLLLFLSPLLLMLMRKKRFFFLACILACIGLPALSQGANYQVTPASDNNCGDLDCDLRNALQEAQANGADDTIFIAPGTYQASGGAFAYNTFQNNSLAIIGSGADQTFLDGGGQNQVMFLVTDNGPPDANADISISNITFQNGNSTFLNGGGLIVITRDADISVSGCAFFLNRMTFITTSFFVGGGGLFAESTNFGSIRLLNNFFLDNSAPDANGGGSFTHTVQGATIVQGNTYINNDSLTLNPSSDVNNGGGAVAFSDNEELLFKDNVFFANEASNFGGAVAAVSGFSTLRFINNLVVRNTSSVIAAPITGAGGVFIQSGGSTIMTNNTIVENTAVTGIGGGLGAFLLTDTAELTLFNNIIWGNNASGGGFCNPSCNDIGVNDDGDLNHVGASFSISHSNFSDIFFGCSALLDPTCVPNQQIDDTNLDLDPSFVAPFQNDFHLADGSPLIDKGDPEALDLPLLDLDGELRIQGPAPDMGVFESDQVPLPPSEHCANGLDDDGDNDVDCSDEDCSGAAACLGNNQGESENCANNEDDDGDGSTDCGDSNCVGAIACQPGAPSGGENCANNVDDDGDGDIDCLDSACSGAAACAGGEAPGASDGGGCTFTEGSGSFSAILLLLAPILLVLRRRVFH